MKINSKEIHQRAIRVATIAFLLKKENSKCLQNYSHLIFFFLKVGGEKRTLDSNKSSTLCGVCFYFPEPPFPHFTNRTHSGY